MIKVHRPRGEDPQAEVIDFPDCDGWEADFPSGFLVVKEGSESMAIFPPHQWEWVQDAKATEAAAKESPA